MDARIDTRPNRDQARFPYWLGVSLLAAIAVFFLWEEHQAHFLGALPYLLLLACPLLHLLMHRGHGHRNHDSHSGREAGQ